MITLMRTILRRTIALEVVRKHHFEYLLFPDHSADGFHEDSDQDDVIYYDDDGDDHDWR
jgi:hypothetical protein